jgi:hypothetical protein
MYELGHGRAGGRGIAGSYRRIHPLVIGYRITGQGALALFEDRRPGDGSGNTARQRG